MNTLRKTDKQLSSLISRIGHRDEGFSMISAIMALMVGTLLSLAAWATANSDINFTDKDKWSRLAYQRAQSGVSDYVQHMAEDSGYWKACDRPDGVTGDGLGQTALNDNDFGATLHPTRRWLPYSSAGSTTDLGYNAQYTIDLEPSTGSCKPSATAADRMIDPASGTFKVAVTGRAGPLVPANLTGSAIEDWRQQNWRRATIVAEFRRNGFLDYAYFTDHEGVDPLLQASTNGCDGYYQDDPGYTSSMGLTSEPPYPGRYRYTSCTELNFFDGDRVLGPFHTNDSVLLSITPTSTAGAIFGNTNKGDRIEVYDNGKQASNGLTGTCPFRVGAATPGTTTVTSPCRTNPRPIAGTTVVSGPAAKFLDLPEDNEDLQLYADPASGDPESQGYSYYGKTRIVINANNTLDITNALVNGGATQTGLAFPTSGVIYVYNNGVTNCQSDPYNKSYALSIPAGCALVEVQGTFNKSLTIGSEADVVVTGDIERGTASQTAVVGLIANQYARVRHYSTSGGNYTNTSGNCVSDGVTGTQITDIQAAILTLNRSFTYDGYQCGPNMGFLRLTGALAQRWRGGVSQGVSINSAGTTCTGGKGYCKLYSYDYNFKSQTPPHFLAPSAATWKIIRMRQTLPACNCAKNG